MKFMIAIALFCVLAYAHAGLPRSGSGPPRSTGPHNPPGGFRFRRDVEQEESVMPQEEALYNMGAYADLPAGAVRLNTDPEDQVNPLVYGLNAAYRQRRYLENDSFDEEEDVY